MHRVAGLAVGHRSSWSRAKKNIYNNAALIRLGIYGRS